MADELIRLDTTIIGIDSLINKATAEEAKVLFTVKDVIYSQQRYFTDVQPVKRGKWIGVDYDTYFECSECKHMTDWQQYKYCPYCGARMDGEQNE